MDTTKKITYEDCKKVINDISMLTAEVDWNGLELNVKKNLSFSEAANFVSYVVGLCFIEGTNEYIPEARDFAIRVCTIESYTNVELPESIEERNKVVYNTDLMQTVLKNVDAQQFNSLIQAIDIKLDYLSNANVELLNNKFEKLLDSFEKLYQSVAGVFEGITPDSLKSLVNAIKDDKFDENELIKAYFAEKEEKESE